MASQKRTRAIDGDVFLIPLLDGTFSIGQVIKATTGVMNSVLCSLFNLRGERPKIDAGLLDPKLIVAVHFITAESLQKGAWIIVRNEAPNYDPNDYLPIDQLASKGWVGARVVGSGIIDSLMNAYFCLRPWDNWHDPEYLDKLLATGVSRPSGAVLTKGRH